MRVLAMLHAYVPQHGAGAETTAHALFRHLVQCGHEVDVILSRVDPAALEDYAFDGVRVHVHRGKAQTPQWLASANRPHVIVTHLENTARAAILGDMYEIPVVQLLHNHRPETLSSVVRHRFALLVCNTEWILEAYRQFWADNHPHAPAPRMICVRPPVHVEEYSVKPGSHVTLVNLTVDKGVHVFYGLAEKFRNAAFLGVLGAYGVQTVRTDLSNVEIQPHVPSRAMASTVYARTKVLLMPSSYESYGRVAVEAACSGIPVIAHPTPGLREALGDDAVFCDRDDLDAWAVALRRLLTPRAWSAQSKASLARASELDPTAELAVWAAALEQVARGGVRAEQAEEVARAEPARHTG